MERQKKAEDMFRSNGVTLDFGSGQNMYYPFARSNSMSRHSRLAFIREELYWPMRSRIMLDMEIRKCQLSKLYAYNGLMLSSGVRMDGIEIEKKHRVIVVDNPVIHTEEPVDVITVEAVEEKDGMKTYRRVERKCPSPSRNSTARDCIQTICQETEPEVWRDSGASFFPDPYALHQGDAPRTGFQTAASRSRRYIHH